jgi:hypothetical protein
MGKGYVIMYKQSVIFFLFTSVLLTVGSAQSHNPAEVIKNSIQDYVYFGSLNANLSWQFDEVEWDHGKSYHHKEIDELEKRLKSHPNDISACVKLLYLYDQDNCEEKIASFADECEKRFKLDSSTSSFKQEAQAVLNAQIIRIKKDKSNYRNALSALSPYINSGTALKQTYLIALKICMDLEEYESAVMLADECVAKYPHDLDVYFKRFDILIFRNLIDWIQHIHNNTMSQFLQNEGATEINTENYREFEEKFFTNLHTQLGMKDIEALAQEFLDDYKITMKIIDYKLVILYWTRMLLCATMVTDDMEEDEILELIFHSDATALFDFSSYFEHALRTRPKRDVNIFCALFVYYFYQKDLKRASEYAQQVLALRPDMYFGYNGLILLECFSNMDKIKNKEYSFDTLHGMYVNKIENTGGEETDYVFLISDCIEKYHNASQQEQNKLSVQIENHIKNIFALNEQSEWGYLMQGGYYMLTGCFAEAIELYNRLGDTENQDIKKILFNNRAAAKILTGDAAGARKDLDKSLSLNKKDEKSLKILELLDAE